MAGAVGLTGFLTISYGIGGDTTQAAMGEFIEDARLMEAFKAAEAVQPSMLWITLGFFGAMGYIAVLLALPFILGIGDSGDENGDGNDKP